MSDIPKSKRAHSNLEAHHQALAVRRMISVELLSSFAYSEKKLKAYKRLLDDGRIDMETVENSFKSWLGGNWKLMSQEQIKNIYALYYALFQRRIT